MEENKSCYECRYFESSSLCCQKLWRTHAIFDGEKSASKCNNYVEGSYNPTLIEEEFWNRSK
ncbi:hypothetical protein ACR77J_07390 [Tissierella praeacuta]|uniref:hypothetical protein n=1 Tax=Tissierella praeacuta TaxID=43131 RepID=UPI003DA664EC